MTAFHLASRTIRRYRAQTILAVAGVAVIGALLFDMLLLSRGLLLSFSDLLDRAGFDVRVVGGGGMSTRLPIADSSALIAQIRELPSVQRVAALRIQSATARTLTARPVGVTLIGATGADEGGWTIVAGRDLTSPPSPAPRCPIVVGRPLATQLSVGAGDTVQLTIQPTGIATALPSLECHVVGIARFAFGSSGDDTVATTMEAFHEATGEAGTGEAELILVASKPDAGPMAVVDAIQTIRPSTRAYSNQQVVDQFNRNGFAYFRQISVVLSSLTMVFAFLLVATLLTVSVNQRLGEIAALRAIGIGRTRIASMLMWESALLVGGGGVLALPLGELPGLPEQLHFFVFEPRALVIHLAVLATTAVAAAAYPVWLATRLPIAATLRREVVD